MGISKRLLSVILAVLLALSLVGCSKKQAGFKVPDEKMPDKVVSTKNPAPTKELMFVRGLAQEAYRRNVVAKQYTRALVHFDAAKGSKEEHKKLVKAAKDAWQKALTAAEVASFYAIGLSQLDRAQGESIYAQAALQEVAPMLLRTAYAAEGRKLTKQEVYRNYQAAGGKKATKDEVYAKHSKKDIAKYAEAYPESKQLLGLMTVLHTDGKTASEIMRDVNPDYEASGRSMSDIANDVAYRSLNVVKTTGHAAGVCLAMATIPTTGGASAALAGGAASVGFTSLGFDALQTLHIVITGEEHKQLQQVVDIAGKAEAVTGLMTFDLSKPILGKSVNVDKLGKLGQVQQYAKANAQGAKELFGKLAAGELKSAAKVVNTEAAYNAVSSSYGVYDSFLKGEDDTLVVSTSTGDDGSTITRSATVNSKNPDAAVLEAMGMTGEELKKTVENDTAAQAVAATASAGDIAKGAEEVAKEAPKNYDTVMELMGNDLMKGLIGPGGFDQAKLSALLSQQAGIEMRATGVSFVTDSKGNVTKALVTGEAANKNENYAVKNVVGQYNLDVQYRTGTGKIKTEPITVSVTDGGSKPVMTYTFYVNFDDGRAPKPYSYPTTVTAYDAKTGRGTLNAGEYGSYSFQFSGRPKAMSLTVQLQ